MKGITSKKGIYTDVFKTVIRPTNFVPKFDGKWENSRGRYKKKNCKERLYGM